MSLPRVPGYNVVVKIKEGGSATIFKGERFPHGETVALKVLHPRHVGNKEMEKAFQNEIKYMAMMEHPTIIRFNREVEGAERPTFDMEYFESTPLSTLLAQEESLSFDRALPIFRHVAEGLAHTHDRGVLHKDIKPGNVLLGAGDAVRLIDYSIAEPIKKGFFARLFGGKKEIQGTLSYISPEALLKKDLTPAADVWSLGILIFETLTGKKPFVGRSEQQLAEAIVRNPTPGLGERAPKGMSDLLGRMLEKKPEARISSMHEVIDTLATFA